MKPIYPKPLAVALGGIYGVLMSRPITSIRVVKCRQCDGRLLMVACPRCRGNKLEILL